MSSKYFTIILSCSPCKIRASYPVTSWVRDGFKVKVGNESFIVAFSRCRQNLKYGDFMLLFCGARKRKTLKCVAHEQHDYFPPFNHSCHRCFNTPCILFLVHSVLNCGENRKRFLQLEQERYTCITRVS